MLRKTYVRTVLSAFPSKLCCISPRLLKRKGHNGREISKKYMPLQNNSSEIRLAILNPASNFEADIELHLVHSSLRGSRCNVPGEENIASPPRYSALSYVWGDNKITKPIILNGQETTVTSNLESALRHLRLENDERRLWIDALCINQDDIPERNDQILLMRDIYVMAEKVIVWLGDAGPNSGFAMNFVSEHVNIDGGTLDEEKMLDSLKEDGAPLAFETLGGDLLKRSWWRRIWVVQEIACSTCAIVRCGPYEVSWDKLVFALVFSERNHVYTNQLTKEEIERGAFIAPFKEMAKYRRERFLGNPIPLPDLLLNTLRCEATDRRDKVFALLGLAADIEHPLLKPDYSQGWPEVYANLARFLIQRDNSLDVICVAKHDRPNTELPSWVPDWSNNQQISDVLAALSSEKKKYGRYYYRAAGDSQADARFEGDGKILSVSGFGDDIIESVGLLSRNVVEIADIGLSWFKLIAGQEAAGLNETPYVAGDTKYNAFNRTLCVDLDFYGRRAQAGARGFDFNPSLVPADFMEHLPDEERQGEFHSLVIAAMAHFAVRRRFFVTRKGHMGLGPPGTENGDRICILKGCSVPVLLRKEGEFHHLVGEVYVCGIMDGEMMEELQNRKQILQRFVIR